MEPENSTPTSINFFNLTILLTFCFAIWPIIEKFAQYSDAYFANPESAYHLSCKTHHTHAIQQKRPQQRTAD